INNIYLGLPDGFRGDRLITASYIDETMLVFNRNTSTVNQSLISPSAYYDFDNNEGTSDHYVWENAFKNIRACNLFFANIESSTAVTEEQKGVLRGEVHFLRAYL